MHDHCRSCGFKYKIEPSFFFGAMYVSYAVNVAIGVAAFIKYFPVANVVCNLEQYEGLDELTTYRDLKLEETAEIPLRLTDIKHSEWPEMIDEGNFMAGGLNLNSSVHARPKKA